MDNQIIAEIKRAFDRGEYGRVVYQCDELLPNPDHTALRPDILYLKGTAHVMTGHAWIGHAMSCLREGIALAGKRRPLKAKLMAALSGVHSASCDYKSSEKLMKEFARISRDKDPDVMRYGIWLWFNYGIGLDNAFLWEEAASAFHKAAELAEQFAEHDMLGSCLHNLSGSLLQLGRLEETAAIMARAEGLRPVDKFGHKIYSRRAEYHIAAGDPVHAQQWITAALIHPLVDDMTRADVYFSWARTLLALGQPQAAQERALVGLDHAVKAVHYPGIHKLNRFLAQFKA